MEKMRTLLPSTEPNEYQRMLMDRKYGMFIHFGINTFNDLEWSNGKLKLSSYNPSEIDADNWIRNAYMLGMNYVILITKHHDGFCLFDTKYTDYCVKNTPNPTDVVMEVAKACKKYGIKLGLYYSLWDRHEKCYRRHDKYVDYMCNQLTELLDGRYGEVCELWLDGGWDKKAAKWNLPKLYNLVHTLQPNCAFAVNNTIGNPKVKRTEDKYLPNVYEQGMPIKYFPSDFRLWDPFFTKKGDADPKLFSHNGELYYMPFEATICIRNMRNWFWDTKYTEDKLLDVDFITDKYNHLISQGNNLIVNVAPNIYGRQENSDIERLLAASKALGINREI